MSVAEDLAQNHLGGLVKPFVYAGVAVAVVGVAAISHRYITETKRRPRRGCHEEQKHKKAKVAATSTNDKPADLLNPDLEWIPPSPSTTSRTARSKDGRSQEQHVQPPILYRRTRPSSQGPARHTHASPTVSDNDTMSMPVSFGFGVSRSGSVDDQSTFFAGTSCLPINTSTCFLGMYEGHGGESAAKFVAEDLHLEVDRELEVVERDELSFGGRLGDDELKMDTRKEVICMAFNRIDQRLKGQLQMRCHRDGQGSVRHASSGSTALCALYYRQEKKLLIANLGNSRCVVGGNKKVFGTWGSDHKPTNPREAERIRKAGGCCIKDGKIDGVVDVSRSFGDFGWKNETHLLPEEQAISNVPEFFEVDLSAGSELGHFLVLASGEVWNVMTSEELLRFVTDRLGEPCKYLSQSSASPGEMSHQLSSLSEELATHARALGASEKNVSVCIAVLP